MNLTSQNSLKSRLLAQVFVNNMSSDKFQLGIRETPGEHLIRIDLLNSSRSITVEYRMLGCFGRRLLNLCIPPFIDGWAADLQCLGNHRHSRLWMLGSVCNHFLFCCSAAFWAAIAFSPFAIRMQNIPDRIHNLYVLLSRSAIPLTICHNSISFPF